MLTVTSKGRDYFKCDTCGKVYSCKSKDFYSKPSWFKSTCRSCHLHKTPRKAV